MEREPADLFWLSETIQSVVDVPLCISSYSGRALTVALAVVRHPVVHTAIGTIKRLDSILPLVAENNWSIVWPAREGRTIPEQVDQRLDAVRKMVSHTRIWGVPDQNVYIDPQPMTLANNTESALIALDTMRAVRREFPVVRQILCLGDISFGLPARSYIDRSFLTLAQAIGLDAAIFDPSDKEILAALSANELVLGQDRYCLAYARAHGNGRFQSAQNSCIPE